MEWAPPAIWTLLYKVYFHKHECHLTIECVLNYMFRFSTVPHYERCHLHLTLCIMLTIHSEYLTGLIISQWGFVSIELIQIASYASPFFTDDSLKFVFFWIDDSLKFTLYNVTIVLIVVRTWTFTNKQK